MLITALVAVTRLKGIIMAVVNIEEGQPHLTIKGLKGIHVIPESLIQDVIDRRKSITDIEGWEDFIPEIMGDWLSLL